MYPCGIRNNNPLNIRLVPENRWQGRIPPERNSDGEYEQFETPIWGIRAGVRLVIAHFDRRGADTIRKLIEIWAPPSENNTDAYVAFVAARTGFGPDERLDFHRFEHLRPVVEAMIGFENGIQPYTDAQIDKALVLAGVEPPERPLGKTRTVRGARVAAGGTVAAGAAEAIRGHLAEAQGAVAQLVPYLGIARWIMLALVLVGIGVVVWARWDDRRKGLR